MNTVATTLQLRLPDAFRGRVMGVWGLSFNLQSLGGSISGSIAQYAGAPVALAVGRAVVVLAALGVGIGVPRVSGASV